MNTTLIRGTMPVSSIQISNLFLFMTKTIDRSIEKIITYFKDFQEGQLISKFMLRCNNMLCQFISFIINHLKLDTYLIQLLTTSLIFWALEYSFLFFLCPDLYANLSPDFFYAKFIANCPSDKLSRKM